MDDSPFNSSYFWSPVPTVQGQVETNLLLELSWNTHGIVVCAMSKATQKGSPVWLSGPYVKPYMSADSDLTLFILLLTLSDNARLTSHRSCVNVSADVCESLSDNISVSPPQPLCAFILTTFCISLDFFLFWLSSPFITWLHPSKLPRPLTPIPEQQLCVLHSVLPFFLFWALFQLFFPNRPDFPISDLHSPIRWYVLLSSSPHLSLPSFWNGSSSSLRCYFMSLLSLLLPPNCPSTHHHVDGERHVPEQSKGAAWSGEGQCTLFPSLLCIFHLHAPLPHGCAGHSWILGGRSRGACGPKTRGKWGDCRRGRRQWWEQQWQRVIKCGWRTPAPVSHLPEHHSGACTLYGYHDCRWVGSSALLPSGIISCLTPFPFSLSLSHIMCVHFNRNISINVDLEQCQSTKQVMNILMTQ